MHVRKLLQKKGILKSFPNLFSHTFEYKQLHLLNEALNKIMYAAEG